MSTDTPQSPGQTPGDPQEQGTTASTPGAGQSVQAGDSGQNRQKTEEMRERAREVQERIEEGYHELEQRYDDARMQLRQANDTAVSFIRENPALCIAGAIGVGYVVGRLASRRWLS